MGSRLRPSLSPKDMLIVSGILGLMDGAGCVLAVDVETISSRMHCIKASCWLISCTRRASWYGLFAGG